MRKVKVLSLFDGISCGQVALEELGFKVCKYFASEIKKDSIKVTQNNFPNTIQLGDVKKISYKNGILYTENGNYKTKINLVIGGSPCQGFSYAGKRLNFEDERSKLFFEFERILNEIKSYNDKKEIETYFLLENVKMKKESQDIITNRLGVEPIEINSALVSAQNRVRLYWTNIENVDKPKDKGLVLRDIVNKNEEGYFVYQTNYYNYYLNKNNNIKRVDKLKENYCNEIGKNLINLVSKIDNDTPSGLSRQDDRLYGLNGKSPCVTCTIKYIKIDNDSNDINKWKILTPLEWERLQTLPQYVKKLEIILCLDQAKNFVNAVEKNHKLQKIVLSAENEGLRDCVNSVDENMRQNQVQIKPTVHQDVNTMTQKQIKKCIRKNQKDRNFIAEIVGDTTMCQQAGNGGGSVTQYAFMNITEGKITHFGKEDFHQNDSNYTEVQNGKIVLKPYGDETMENVADVVLALEMMQINQCSTSTISYLLDTRSIEQVLTICYWYAKSVIDGFTQKTTKENILYLNLIDGYTKGLSNNKRYKVLGDGWTIDVIKHIFNKMKKERLNKI